MTMLAGWVWRTFVRLVRDLTGAANMKAEDDPNALARDDDVLDAWLDDDGMDATGL